MTCRHSPLRSKAKSRYLILIKTGDAWPLVEPKPLKQKSLGDEVQLVKRRMLTNDSVELTLAFPDHRRLDAQPGQFITLETSIDGQMVRRPYSLSQVDDAKGEFKVAIRLVDGGLMSTHLVQNETSPTLTMLGPSGDFGLAGISHKPKRALLIAAGSGVTPIRSMVEPLLARAKSVKVDVFLLNKDPQSTMYHAELEELAAANSKRLTLTHWYSRHGKDAGRLTRDAFELYLDKTYKKSSPDLIALCGPDAIQDLICAPLESRFPDATLSLETFTPAGSAEPSARGWASKVQSKSSPLLQPVQLPLKAIKPYSTQASRPVSSYPFLVQLGVVVPVSQSAPRVVCPCQLSTHSARLSVKKA